MKQYESWGRYPQVKHQSVVPIYWISEPPDWDALNYSVLPFGQGRSYGDSCLNEGGILLHTEPVRRFLSFDGQSGILRCEAGTTLADVLQLIVPRGWFLPVTPGTKHVTIGGAIANDVHGKNHHRAGTFGCHVTQFALVRSSGEQLLCSPRQNSELFNATIGGLGLTGLILWAEIKLKKISNPLIRMERIPFRSFSEFLELALSSDSQYHYTVAWIDCLAKKNHLGRGVFIRGNHADEELCPPFQNKPRSAFEVPFDMPGFVLNSYTMKAFNAAYYYAHLLKNHRTLSHYDPFFYPLDSISNWNRLYGTQGFLQYQCVVPQDEKGEVMLQILQRIIATNKGTFLSVLKRFGEIRSPGIMSFPRPGLTLALDFAYEGEATLRFLHELDDIVRNAGGVVYPAKDARMSPLNFQSFFPQWKTFAQFVDPKFSSSFWRRVTCSENRARS